MCRGLGFWEARAMTLQPGSRAILCTLVSTLAVTAAAVGLVKHQDQDNRFCVACHLHEALSRKTFEPEPRTLAAAHYRAAGPGHPERCFTCHSGEGVRGWTQVTLLSAWDAARWVAGDRHQPDSMRLKLENPACLKCHAADLRRTGRSVRGMAQAEYHRLTEHRGVRTPCVACHTAHTEGEKPKDFMADAVVRRECARCHPNGLGTESDF